MTPILQQAITAIKAGDKETGKRLLADVLKSAPYNETAWLWMSAVVDSNAQRRTCLERVLEINPDNETAQHGLKKLDLSSPPSIVKKQPAIEMSSSQQSNALTSLQTIQAFSHDATRKCPHCAETIKAEAIRCRFCGSDLTGPKKLSQPQMTKTLPPDHLPLQPLKLGKEDLRAAVKGNNRKPAMSSILLLSLLGICVLGFFISGVRAVLNRSTSGVAPFKPTEAAPTCTPLNTLGWVWDRDCKGEILLYSDPKPSDQTQVTSKIDMDYSYGFSGETLRGDSLITQLHKKCTGVDGKLYYWIDDPDLVDSGLNLTESTGKGTGWIASYFVTEGEQNKPHNACH